MDKPCTITNLPLLYAENDLTVLYALIQHIMLQALVSSSTG